MAGRRGVLKWIGTALMTGLGVVLAVPAAAFLSFPARRRTVSGGEEPVDVGALEALPEDRPVRVAVTVPRRVDAWTAFTQVTLGGAWLIRKGDSVRALSTVCPHAGCSVEWEAQRQQFSCPCHGSLFDRAGAPAGGPTPRGLDDLPVEVKEGRIRVAYRRFRQGVPDKEPV